VGFFQGFAHYIISWYEHRSHITDKANAGSVFTPQYLPSSFRAHPHRTHPELPVSVAEKAMESFSSPPSLGGGMKDVSLPFLCSNVLFVFLKMKKRYSSLWFELDQNYTV
jgi:hypothetical protein